MLNLIFTYVLIFFTCSSHAFVSDITRGLVLETTPNHMMSYGDFLLTQEGGDFEGNGGDVYAIEFRRLAKELIFFFEANQNSLALNFKTALKRLKVYSVRNIYQNETSLSAINFPDRNPPVVIMSRVKWDKIENRKDKLQLVFHELLFIIGLDDTDYQISSQYKLYFVCNFETPLRQYLEISSGKSCLSIGSDYLKSQFEIKLEYMGEYFAWSHLNSKKFPNLKTLLIDNIFLTTKEVLRIIKGLDQLKHLDISKTNLKKRHFSHQELNQLLSKIEKISFGKIDFRVEQNKINEYMTQLISRDQVKEFKRVHSMIKAEYDIGLLESFWFIKTGRNCSPQLMDWFINEIGIDMRVKYRVFENIDILTFGVHHGLNAFEHLILYFNNTIDCFKTLDVFHKAGYQMEMDGNGFSLSDLVKLNFILDSYGKRDLLIYLMENKSFQIESTRARW